MTSAYLPGFAPEVAPQTTLLDELCTYPGCTSPARCLQGQPGDELLPRLFCQACAEEAQREWKEVGYD